jgi:hypothetical protein
MEAVKEKERRGCRAFFMPAVTLRSYDLVIGERRFSIVERWGEQLTGYEHREQGDYYLGTVSKHRPGSLVQELIRQGLSERRARRSV